MFWGKDGRCLRLTNSHLHVPSVWKFWELQTPATLRAFPVLCRDGFTSLIIDFIGSRHVTNSMILLHGI
jgi:hypothetical protein